MTVAELIAALQQVEDQGLQVLAEGCDCINPVVAVDTTVGDGAALLVVRL